MIKSYILYMESGEIVATMVNDPVSAEACAKSSGLLLAESDVAAPDTHYVKGGAILEKPEKPSTPSKFNFSTELWEPDFDSAWSEVRLTRDSKLSATDWTDTLSAKNRLGDGLYQIWQDYRQALRDVTLQPDPFNIVWPVAP